MPNPGPKITLENEVVYWLNEDDEIIYVGKDWNKFADAGLARELCSDMIIGHNLWRYIGGAAKYIYQKIVAEVRKGRSVCIDFRCDTPGFDVYMEMKITLLSLGIVQFETFTKDARVNTSRRRSSDPVQFAEDIIIACSWCGRFKLGNGDWATADLAVNEMSLFNDRPDLCISSGICETCLAKVTARHSEQEMYVLTG